jgi:hypothetical protein
MKNKTKNLVLAVLFLLGFGWPLPSAQAQTYCPPGSCVPPCMQFEVKNDFPLGSNCTLRFVFGFVGGNTCGVNPGGFLVPGQIETVTAPCMYDQCDGGNCVCATAFYIVDQSVPTLINLWGGTAQANGSFTQVPYGDCPLCTSNKIKVEWTTLPSGLKRVTVSCDP